MTVPVAIGAVPVRSYGHCRLAVFVTVGSVKISGLMKLQNCFEFSIFPKDTMSGLLYVYENFKKSYERTITSICSIDLSFYSFDAK